MSRELKFRAWHKKDKRMYPVTTLNFEIGVAALEGFRYCNKKINYSSYKTDHWCGHDYFKNIELMQYTGLKDRDGNEIYEGDIVRYNRGVILLMKWGEENAGFDFDYIKRRKNIVEDIRLHRSDEEFKVIGSIYTNPNLLTGAKQKR